MSTATVTPSVTTSSVTAPPKPKRVRPKAEKFDIRNRPKVQIDPSKVKVNDLMMFPYYGKVTSTLYNGEQLNNQGLEHGLGAYGVHGKELIKNSYSADYVGKEVKVNQTDMIDILTISYNIPFTAVWDTEDNVEHTLRGRLMSVDGRRGRSMCENLDNKEGDRIRMVDHRGLKVLIVDGVKYILKK